MDASASRISVASKPAISRIPWTATWPRPCPDRKLRGLSGPAAKLLKQLLPIPARAWALAVRPCAGPGSTEQTQTVRTCREPAVPGARRSPPSPLFG